MKIGEKTHKLEPQPCLYCGKTMAGASSLLNDGEPDDTPAAAAAADKVVLAICMNCAQPMLFDDDMKLTKLPAGFELPEDVEVAMRAIRSLDRRPKLTDEHIFKVCGMGQTGSCRYLVPIRDGGDVLIACVKGSERAAAADDRVRLGFRHDGDNCEGRRGALVVDSETLRRVPGLRQTLEEVISAIEFMEKRRGFR